MVMRALVFTDVVDSTRIVEQLGDARAAQAWADHDRRVRNLLAQHRGREIGRADGLFAIFDDPADAARYALAYHDALSDLPFSARAGLHVGPLTLRDNAPADMARGALPVEVEGLATPYTARLMALAGPGQTLISRAARDALASALPERAEIENHGWFRLKGIEDPVEIFELGEPGRAPFAPPNDVEKAYRVVFIGELWVPARDVRHNLPAERDGFVGRTAELRVLAARFDAGVRLVSVLGPGGTGKTRFVRRYGWKWLGDWPGGVYFVDLSEARSIDAIYFAVASALETPLSGSDSAVQIGRAIAGRGRCLVILDNFEQIVDFARDTVSRWLDAAADARFLVTSRIRLQLAGEEAFTIEPLSLEVEALELFEMRARAQRPDFAVTTENRDAVVQIVRLLDGLPLAVELAAARIRVLSPAQLLDRLRDRFTVLAGAPTATARQATLRRAIDWSWDLLAAFEQAAFAQCSTFEGGFTLEAAEAVLDLSPWPDAPIVMDVVQALADKSLLRTWLPSGQRRHDIDEPYFGMYLSIREYAAAKLAGSPALARAAEERHGRWFARFGDDEAIEALSRAGGVRRRHLLALELDNLVAACRRAVARGDGATAVGAWRAAWGVIELQGPYALGVKLGGEVLALPDLDRSQRARALVANGGALRRTGRSESAAAAFERAFALAQEISDRPREAEVLGYWGNLCRDQGLMLEAQAKLEAALAIAREGGNRRLEGSVLGNIGCAHGEQGRPEQARLHFEQALAIHREVGNRFLEGIDTSNLGNAWREQGRHEEAAACYERARDIDREVGNRRDEAIATINLGQLRYRQGRSDAAVELYTTGLAIAREVGDYRVEGFVVGELGNIFYERGRLEDARGYFERALAIDRAVGNRRSEGAVLGRIANLLARQGRFDEARDSFRSGEALLRQTVDRWALLQLLCDLGRAESLAGERDAARAALTAARAEAAAMDEDSQAEALRTIGALRDLLE